MRLSIGFVRVRPDSSGYLWSLVAEVFLVEMTWEIGWSSWALVSSPLLEVPSKPWSLSSLWSLSAMARISGRIRKGVVQRGRRQLP